MRNHYAITLNPSPYHKWNKLDVNVMYSKGSICSSNYMKLPHFVQKNLLLDIYEFFKKHVSGDFSEPNFETTKLNNLHIHAHFSTDLEMKDFQGIIDKINGIFSNTEKWQALYVEQTHTNIKPWHKYETKEHYLQVLMERVIVPSDSDPND